MIYIDAEMLGQDCSFAFAVRVAGYLSDAGYPCRAFDSSGVVPAGYDSATQIPDDVFLGAIEKAIEDDEKNESPF